MEGGFLAGTIRRALRLGHVAAVAEGHAQVAVDQVGHRLRLELANVRPQFHQQVTGRRQVRRFGAPRVAAQVIEHHGQHFVRRVDHRDAAVGEFRRQFRFEQHVQAVDRRIRRTLGDLPGVVGQADGTPGVRDRGLARLLIVRAQFLQPRLDVIQSSKF
ncbi:hypothetical protein D9M73_173510 [compost metagenome]